MFMKKAPKLFIVIIMAILGICVFPLCLVRKNADICSNLNGAVYENTNYTGNELKQTFVAQTEYLSEIAFDIAFPDVKPDTGSLIFCIKEEGEHPKVLMETQLSLETVNSLAFTSVSVDKWLKKGKLYSYTIIPHEGTDAAFQAVYTVREEDASAGNQTLYFDGKIIDGQAVTKYVYGFPLNWRNVICLWAFIAMIGLMLINVFADRQFLGNNKLLKKADMLLTKYQYPILLLEFVVILLMIIRICNNEAVHWDEAYTWQMVTRNTLPQMLRATAADVHPPLYYMLVMGAMKIFGQKIFVAKMVSVAGAAATQIIGIVFIRKHWGVKAAIPFLLVTGLGTQMIYFNVDVRMYSWVIFFVLAAGIFAYEIMLSGKNVWWAAFTIASLGGVYTQYFSVVPLALMYLFLAVWIVAKNRGQLKKWIICCVATIAGYLPWLAVVIDTLERNAGGTETTENLPGIGKLCQWAFENNIKFSASMPVILFLTACLCLVIEYRRLSDKERVFQGFIGCLLPLSYGICMLLKLVMNHFWDNRYVVDALLFTWLFMIICLSRQKFATWCVSMIWLGIMSLSSYTVMQARELNTVPWIQQAKQLLEQVQGEEKIIYTYPTFDVLYQYYVPDAEFIWREDVDFSDWKNGECYVIDWGAMTFLGGLCTKKVFFTKKLSGVCVWRKELPQNYGN